MSYDARCGTIKLITPDLMVPEHAALNTDFVCTLILELGFYLKCCNDKRAKLGMTIPR